MNDDMPWVDLTPEEIQELRTNKQELTEYGKQKIQELMNDGKMRFYDKGKETFAVEDPYWGKVQTPEMKLEVKEMTHEEMMELAAEREAANEAIIAKVSEEDYRKVQEEIANKKALEELDKLYDENGDALQQLAAIEREELLEKMSSQAIQTAIDGIGKYSDALKELRKIEHEELIEELQAKKKENFQLVADACMKEYEQKYQRDVFPVDEHWVYMVSEYFGTGEGQTVCIMMTQAAPSHPEDFETSTNKYVACTTKQYRAVRAFHEQFGTWYLHGLKFLSKEDFFTECAYYIPPVMMKLSNKSCFKDFYTRVHYNFS
jgi:hypothetical protein